MNKKFDTIVFICRAQPFHNAHLEIIKRCTALTNQVIIIVGSANQPRTYKNPFTFAERSEMIVEATRGLSMNVHVKPNIDTVYNDQAWAIRVQKIVKDTLYDTKGNGTHKVGIIGHKKDDSSFYLSMFPQWEFIDVEEIEPLGATDIRGLFFKRDVNMNFIKHVVPKSTFDFLTKFKETDAYKNVIAEREFIEAYKKQYASLPYPPVFVTADAVVIQSGHVLMIKRRAAPGKGLWALPGGFLNANSDRSVEDAAIRELREETGIKVPVPVIRGSIVKSRVFDAIDRSSRGRTITHAFHIELPDGELSKVKGSDDAEKARWCPISEVRSEDCFEDHFDLISWATGA